MVAYDFRSIKRKMARRQHWLFTLNNYTADEVDHLSAESIEGVEYLIFGKEVGESGTPHLQGFVALESRSRRAQVKALLGDRVHFDDEPVRSLYYGIEYCKKGEQSHEEWAERQRSRLRIEC